MTGVQGLDCFEISSCRLLLWYAHILLVSCIQTAFYYVIRFKSFCEVRVIKFDDYTSH